MDYNELTTAGVDEAGRGPLAGPVVAAAVIITKKNLEELKNLGISDSKKLSKQKRELLYSEIVNRALNYSIVTVGHSRIDKINIRNATELAMRLAIKKVNPKLALIDGNMRVNVTCDQETIIKGDLLVPLISAASILAKVYRDKLMETLDKKYPGYKFAIHQGYPTKKHKELISTLGPSKIHRRTFAGVKEHIKISTNV